MKIQIVREWSDDKIIVSHSTNIGKVHEVYGDVMLWLETMFVNENIYFYQGIDLWKNKQWKSNWEKQIFSYLRYRAYEVE